MDSQENEKPQMAQYFEGLPYLQILSLVGCLSEETKKKCPFSGCRREEVNILKYAQGILLNINKDPFCRGKDTTEPYSI